MLGLGLGILLLSVVLYMVLVAMVLPRFVLKDSYRVKEPTDRGVKRCTFEGKPCIIYSSSKENKPYIKQYILLDEGEHKILKCKASDGVDYLDYDIVVFNRYNQPFEVINVKEDVVGEVTKSTRLPSDTAYVRLVIRQANRVKLKKPATFGVSGGSIFAFSLLALVLTALEAFAVRATCSLAFGDVYRESFISSTVGFWVIGAVALAVGVLGAISVMITSSNRGRK